VPERISRYTPNPGGTRGPHIACQNPHGSEAARGKGNIKMEGVDLTVMLPPTFQGKICPPFDRLPYFVPLTTASSIWTYSVVRVPYRLLLAAVFSHLPIGGSYPTDLY